jgi:hypothetical protein
MSYAKQMLETYRHPFTADAEALAAAIDALADCAQACTADADANLSEQNVAEMVQCIRLCLDCGDICTATVAVASRPARHDKRVIEPLLNACASICKSCGDECARHAQMHPHCGVCQGACTRGEQACRDLLDAIR